MYTCIDDISSFCQTGNPEPKTQILTCTCSPGLGDRLRGIMMFLRAAAASKRVLLIDIASPTDMREFFLPALIDWTVGLLALPKPDFPWKAGEGDDREALFKSNAALLLPAQYLVVQGDSAAWGGRKRHKKVPSTHKHIWPGWLQLSSLCRQPKGT